MIRISNPIAVGLVGGDGCLGHGDADDRVGLAPRQVAQFDLRLGRNAVVRGRSGGPGGVPSDEGNEGPEEEAKGDRIRALHWYVGWLVSRPGG